MTEDHIRDEAIDDVDWSAGGRVHNWRNYVGENVRAIWDTLGDTAKVAIAKDADELAGREHWD